MVLEGGLNFQVSSFMGSYFLVTVFKISAECRNDGTSESKVKKIFPGEKCPRTPTFTKSVFHVSPRLLEIFHNWALKGGGGIFQKQYEQVVRFLSAPTPLPAASPRGGGGGVVSDWSLSHD